LVPTYVSQDVLEKNHSTLSSLWGEQRQFFQTWISAKRAINKIAADCYIIMYMSQSSCFLLFSLIPFYSHSLSPFFVPFTYLETLLAVTGSVHLGLRLLVNWPPLSSTFSHSLPTPNSQYPG
jgi:hypothetical protein